MNLIIFLVYVLFLLIYLIFFGYTAYRFWQIRMTGDKIPLALIIFGLFVATVIVVSILSFLTQL